MEGEVQTSDSRLEILPHVMGTIGLLWTILLPGTGTRWSFCRCVGALYPPYTLSLGCPMHGKMLHNSAGPYDSGSGRLAALGGVGSMYQTGHPSDSCHVVENRFFVGGKPCGLAVSELLTFPGVSPKGVKVVVIHRLGVTPGVPHPSVYVHARE